MAEEAEVSASAEQPDPFANLRSGKPWLQAIQDAEKVFERWHQACDTVDKMYADAERIDKNVDREYQIFWANMEVVRPSLYARPPVPVVAARFKDRKPLVRHASEILERSLVTSFADEDMDGTMKLVRDDLALYSRGASWLRYEANDTSEKVPYEHVDRRDFLHEPARKWKEVGMVARRSWLTRKKMAERFKETSEGLYLQAKYSKKKDENDEYETEATAAVWEIWSKTHNCVVWVTPGVNDGVLDIQAPFLDLKGFFPCPKPAYGTIKRGTLIPVPDYAFCKDQIEEINELTKRIALLAQHLKLRGFYPSGGGDLSDSVEAALHARDDGRVLVGISNTAAFADKALKDIIVWLPTDMIANTIKELLLLRRELIGDVYQITGISDIMRGQTDPNETKGAQVLKSQYGSIRISDKQGELVRVARDMTRIAAEIMAENFSPETLLAMSQYEGCPSQAMVQQQVQQMQRQAMQAAQQAQDPQQGQQIVMQAAQQAQKLLQTTVTLEQVFQFLRDERVRPFTLDIETDSTIQPNEAEQQDRVARYMGALAPLIQQISAMIAAEPATAPFAGEVLKFGSKQFRVGREMDGAIDELIETMGKKAGQPKPNPEQEKLAAQKESDKAKLDFEREKHADQMNFEREKAAMERSDRQDEFLQANGVPVVYSYEQEQAVNQQQFEALMQGQQQTTAAMAQMLAQLAEAFQAFAAVQAAPKTITLPDGRTFTASVGNQGMMQ